MHIIIENCTRENRQIKLALNAGWNVIKSVSHNLKGMSLNIHADAFSTVLKELESATENQDPFKAKEYYLALKEEEARLLGSV